MSVPTTNVPVPRDRVLRDLRARAVELASLARKFGSVVGNFGSVVGERLLFVRDLLADRVQLSLGSLPFDPDLSPGLGQALLCLVVASVSTSRDRD
jgi:hypothetical protein